MLHIAICDDNIDELSNMVHLLNLYRIEKNLNCEYAVFSNGFELMATLEKGKYFDIYLLDIIMPGFMGIDVAKAIRTFDQIAPILFFTSSPEFALQSYSVKALNYILKPISKEKFFITFDDLLNQLTFEKDEDVLIVKSSEGIQKIRLSTILYVEVVSRTVYYYLLSGKVVKCLEPFALVSEKLLNYDNFLKSHRSYIVNMQYIDTIDTKQITLQTSAIVPIAQGKASDIKQQYLAYQMEVDA